MKRIRTAILLLAIGIIPFGYLASQEKKNEQKIKVIVADKNGTKVVIDTTYINTDAPDSIIINDGKVIYFTGRDNEHPGIEKHYKVVARLDKNDGNKASSYVYVNKSGDESEKAGGIYDITVSDEYSDNSGDNETDRTRYVIARNGITVSIEGKDEAAIKELADKIRKDLAVIKKEKE
jgi:ABC-type Fe3+ transport system substrate-binding protein